MKPCSERDHHPAAIQAAPLWDARHHLAEDAPARTTSAAPLSLELEAFLLDRFSTTLEDPRTGRRL